MHVVQNCQGTLWDKKTQKAYFILNGNLPRVWLAAKGLFWATAHVWSPASKLQHDYEAFWSYFYIWCGFLCAQVPSGNCETTESWRIAIFSVKPQIHVRIVIVLTGSPHSQTPQGRDELLGKRRARRREGAGAKRQIDCEQSLFFLVTRVAICVSRVLLDGLQKKERLLVV